ncbi:MAG: head fiber protein [Clostridia bacterium]
MAELKFLSKDGAIYFWEKVKTWVTSKMPTNVSQLNNDAGYLKAIDSIPASSTTPKMNGVSTIGIEEKYSRGDHVHPSDTTKVTISAGKGLSTNDYTTDEKTKLATIAVNANAYTLPAATVTALGGVKVGENISVASGVISVPEATGTISGVTKVIDNVTSSDTTNAASANAVRTANATAVAVQNTLSTHCSNATHITAAERTTWNAKSTFDGAYASLTGKPSIPALAPIIDTSTTTSATPNAVKIYVDTSISTAIASVYKAAGTITFANLPKPDRSIEGYVYNVNDAFSTTAAFVEGPGKAHPAGTNIVCIQTDTGGTKSYVWDVIGGFIDMSPYMRTSDLIPLTNAEIDAICV